MARVGGVTFEKQLVTTREVTAAVHDAIPFLGVAYAAERVRAESRLDAVRVDVDIDAGPTAAVEAITTADWSTTSVRGTTPVAMMTPS